MSKIKPFDMHKNAKTTDGRQKTMKSTQQAKIYVPSDGIRQGEMPRSGKPSTIKRSAAFTSTNKYNMPNYLTHPYIYIQKIFLHGKYKTMVHPDVFIDFEYVKNSFRNNKNLFSEELYDALRRMTKDERYQFYSRFIEMNEQLFDTFQKMADALKYRGMIELPDIAWHKKPLVPKDQLLKLAKGLLNSNEEISLTGLIQFLNRIGYTKDSLEKDAHQLFYNVLVGDNPIKIASRVVGQVIPFRALIHNISRYLKKEYRLRGIFTLNSSTQRNKIIQDSIEPFVGENWKIFKQRLKAQQEKEMPETFPDRDELIRLKRIYSKHLYHKSLRFVLSDINKIIQEYTFDINKVKADLELISHFFQGLFKQIDADEFSLEEAVNFIVAKKVPQVYVDQYVSFMRKILKFIEVPITQQTFEFSKQNPTEATIITKSEIERFVQHYSAKKQKDLNIFKDFVLKLKEFEKDFINTVKLQHFECWRWNMVGEWLVKKLSRMDKSILKELGWKQYKDFLKPLPVEIVVVENIEVDRTEEDLEKAINNINQVAEEFSKSITLKQVS